MNKSKLGARAALVIAALAVAAVPDLALAAEGGWSGSTKLIGMVVNFIILLAIIGLFGMKKIRVSLETRKEILEREINEATRLHEEARARLTEIEQRAAQLDAERDRILDEYRSLGEAERRSIIADAERSAARVRHDARKAADLEMAQAQRTVRDRILQRSMTRAEAQLQEQINTQTQQRLVDSYIDSLAALAVADASEPRN